MTPFQTHRGRLATLDRSNVDTDQIIAKQFLKSIKRTGFGEHLFRDWRFTPDGSPDPSFELNAERFQGASQPASRRPSRPRRHSASWFQLGTSWLTTSTYSSGEAPREHVEPLPGQICQRPCWMPPWM